MNNCATSKLNEALTEHGGQLTGVLPLAVHQKMLFDRQKKFFEFFCGTPPSFLKVIGWWWVVGGLQNFSVSPSPLWVNLGFKLGWTGLGLGLEGLGTNGFGVGD